MARKSRVNLPVETGVQTPEKVILKTAVYARLSRETEVNVERGTLDNQVSYIKDYISRQDDLEIYDVYVDDYTGTKFDRPEFERMLNDIRSGRIDAVVVKDLSRLGRDHIETGNFLENVFPMFGVRFIAINDCYDSEKENDGLMAAVTNIANALYAKDISKKISTAYHRLMEQGIPASGVPFGYKVIINENHIREMVVDEEAAAIVRKIFSLYIEGKRRAEICKILNADNAPTPNQYRFRDREEKLAEYAHCKWDLHILAPILNNETYTGIFYSGKSERCLYQNKEVKRKDKSEWLVFENHHEAIISKEDFNKAMEMVRPSYKKNKPIENIFRKKIFCGHCGKSMSVTGSPYVKRSYRCRTQQRYGRKSCENEIISSEIIEKTVLEQIRIMIKLLLDTDEAVKKIKASDEYAVEANKINAVYAAQLDEFKRLENHKNDMYMHLCEGLIDETEYLTFNKLISAKIEAAEQKLSEIEKFTKMLAKSPLDDSAIRDSIKAFKNKRKLSRDMVEAFIDKILIYKGNRIEIVFNFNDEIKKLLKRKADGEI